MFSSDNLEINQFSEIINENIINNEIKKIDDNFSLIVNDEESLRKGQYNIVKYEGCKISHNKDSIFSEIKIFPSENSNSISPPNIYINSYDCSKNNFSSKISNTPNNSNSLLKLFDYKRGDDLTIRSIKGLSMSSIRENSSSSLSNIRNNDLSFYNAASERVN
jgi:hypothetical protein